MMSDPFPTMSSGAVALHELYISLVAAGFTEHQALILIGVVLSQSRPR